MAVVQTPQGGMSVATPQVATVPVAPQPETPQAEVPTSPIVKFGTATKLFNTPTTQTPVQQVSSQVD